jgi:hypothetical protein
MGYVYNALTGNVDIVINKAQQIKFTPTTPADWEAPIPTNVKEALDYLAANDVKRVVSGSFLSPIVITSDISTTNGVDEDMYIKSNGGVFNIVASPQVTYGTVDGQTLRLIGTSNTDCVLLEPDSWLDINGDWMSYLGAVLTLRWDHSFSVWREVSRSS